ncbi:MAG: AEC family transporter [Clostridiales bacterium]|nr:AEC family transporter [Clostridiales bacterium]MDO5139972.1 AEC family transporter [Eubacteriales bacterium]
MFFTTFRSITELFILVLIGYIMFKKGLIGKDGIRSMNSILIHLSVSALMLRSFQSDMLWNNASALVYGIGYSFLFQLTLIGLSFILIRKNAEDASVDRSCIAFNNVGFIAMPVIGAVFGDMGVFYASCSVFVFNIVFWIIGMGPIMMTGERSAEMVKKNLFSDRTLVTVIAALLLIFKIRLPEIIMSPVNYLSSLNAPIAMINTGCIIASCDIRAVVSKRVIQVSFLRLVVSSLLCCLLLRFVIRDDLTFRSFALMASCSTGSFIPILAEQYDKNAARASGCFLVTTLGCIITMPLMMLLF